MQQIEYKITTKEPVLISRRTNMTNQAETESFIPGNLISSFIAGQLGETGKISKFVFNDKIRYLNAYPLSNDKICFPAPLSLHIEKDVSGKAPVINLITETPPKDMQTRSLKNKFIIIENNEIRDYKPNKKLNTHNYVVNQRKLTGDDIDKKDIFSYIAIGREEVFKGKIAVADEFARELYDLIKDIQSIYLGRSRSAGYGECDIDFSGPAPYENDLNGKTDDKDLVITLLSDAVLINENNKFEAYINEDILNHELKRAGIEDAPVRKITKAVSDNLEINGFNAHHGLPRKTRLAVSRGSVFSYELKRPLSEEEVNKMTSTGIGLFRNEGYGDIAVNMDVHNKQLAYIPPGKDGDGGTKKWHEINYPGNDVKNIVFSNKIESAVKSRVYDIVMKNRGLMNRPSNTQLMTLANKALSMKGTEAIEKFLDDKIGKSSDRRGDWNVKVNGVKLFDFIKDNLLKQDKFFEEIKLDNIDKKDKSQHYINSLKTFIVILTKAIIKERK